MQRGSLIIYDNNGTVLVNTGDAEGAILPHETPEGVPYIITEYGALNGKIVLGVDVLSIPHQLITQNLIDYIVPKQPQGPTLEERIAALEEAQLATMGL